jgi:hypothetical protein
MGTAMETDSMDSLATEFSGLLMEAVRQSKLDAALQTRFI